MANEKPETQAGIDPWAEIERLSAINAELLAALQQIAAHTEHGDNVPAIINTLARAAIAKAKGE